VESCQGSVVSGSCPEGAEGWYGQPYCRGTSIASISSRDDNKRCCCKLIAGKHSGRQASDCKSCLEICVISLKPTKSTFYLNCRRDEARAQQPDLPEPMGTEAAPMYPGQNLRGRCTGVSCQCSARWRKRKNYMSSDLPALSCTQEGIGHVLLPTLELGKCGAELTAHPVPSADALGPRAHGVCMPQPGEKP